MTTLDTDVTLAEAFNARLDGDGCAHALFPEIADNPVAAGLIDECMSAIVGNYSQAGAMVQAGMVDTATALDKVAETINHALVIATAFGYALGQSHAADTVSGFDVPEDASSLLSDEEHGTFVVSLPVSNDDTDGDGPEAA